MVCWCECHILGLIFESGRVRLLVAFIAAMAVHGLLFMTPPQQVGKHAYSSIQVEFLAQPHIAAKVAVKQLDNEKPTLQKKAPVAQRKVAKKAMPQPVLHQPTKNPAKSLVKQKTTITNTEEAKTVTMLVEAKNTAVVQEQKVDDNVDMVMPVDMRKRILTHVSYPMRARRRGWEGKAEFRIKVQEQAIQHVTMLASTGYALLDDAAQKGIASIGFLPLHDGSYRFPVVFQLQ